VVVMGGHMAVELGDAIRPENAQPTRRTDRQAGAAPVGAVGRSSWSVFWSLCPLCALCGCFRSSSSRPTTEDTEDTEPNRIKQAVGNLRPLGSAGLLGRRPVRRSATQPSHRRIDRCVEDREPTEGVDDCVAHAGRARARIDPSAKPACGASTRRGPSSLRTAPRPGCRRRIRLTAARQHSRTGQARRPRRGRRAVDADRRYAAPLRRRAAPSRAP
jgi:hypothetical protein